MGYWGEWGFTAGYPAVCLVIPVPQIALAGRNDTELIDGRVQGTAGNRVLHVTGYAGYIVIQSTGYCKVKNTAEY